MYDGGDEDSENKCCGCCEIRCGVKILAVFAILGGIGVIGNIGHMGQMPLVATIGLVLGIPNIIAAWWFIQWYQEDTKETRAKLPTAGKLQLICLVLQSIVSLIATFIIANKAEKFAEKSDDGKKVQEVLDKRKKQLSQGKTITSKPVGHTPGGETAGSFESAFNFFSKEKEKKATTQQSKNYF